MNRIHSFAKVALAAIGIFFALRIAPQLLTVFMIVKMSPSVMSYWVAAAWAAALGLCIVILLYVFVYKREQLAKRIAGEDDLNKQDSQMHWLPVAFRLVCIAGGLYGLYLVLFQVPYFIIQYISYTHSQLTTVYGQWITERVLSLLIVLAIAIYLLCGAPHFVRWQVKKTLEQCKKQSEINR